MVLLLNILFAVLFGWFANYLLERAGVDRPIAVLCGVIVGVLIYLVNIGGQLV